MVGGVSSGQSPKPSASSPTHKNNTPHPQEIKITILYHDYIREHSGLDGKTPSEACGSK
jgi:hypothetical protein